MMAYLKGNPIGMNPKHSILQLCQDFTIGRGTLTEVNVCLMDVNISRKHCQFNHENNVWTITDLSSNGVWVNGVRIAKNSPIKLQDQDKIVLSDLQHLYSWTFNLGEASQRSSDETDSEAPVAKKPRLTIPINRNYNTEKLDEAVSEIRKVAEVRILREKLRLENAAKLSEERLSALEEERKMLISRLEAQNKLQARKEIEARELLLKETEGKVDREEVMREFEEKMKLERESAEEQRNSIVRNLQNRIEEEELKRANEIQEREEKVAKLNKEKIELAEKMESERKLMEIELKQLQEKLEKENTSKESLEKEWKTKLDSLTHKMELSVKKEKEDMEKAVNKEKCEKENLEKEMNLQKTLRLAEVKKLEDELELERAAHAAALEMVKEENNLKDEELKRKEKEIEERNLQQQKLEQSMKDQLAELERKKQEIEEQMKQVNMIKDAVEESNAEAEKIETEMKNVAESEQAQNQILLKLAESLEREYQCPTCLDVFIAPVSLNCGHTYCWLCLAQWKNSNGRTRGDLGTCPECREVVKHENRVIAIDHMIDAIMEQLGEEKKKERKEKIAERKGIYYFWCGPTIATFLPILNTPII